MLSSQTFRLGFSGLLTAASLLHGATSPGVDENTVALWLFDEPMYPNVILTDAGSHGYDLRLQSAYGTWYLETEGKGEPPAEPLHVSGEYGLVSGKFGRALYVPEPSIAAVIWPDNRQRYSSASMLGRGSDVPERFNLGYLDWTVEFWFRASGPQPVAATVFEVRNEADHPRSVPMVNAFRMAADRSGFILVSQTVGKTNNSVFDSFYDLELHIPSDQAALDDGEWHHLAFCYAADERQIRHFVDGRLQSLPDKGGFLPMMGVLKVFSFGDELRGLVDEYRISDLVRYAGEFSPPGSFSKNHGDDPRPVNQPNGPPPLFTEEHPSGSPYPLGSRKHVLIDGALIESMENLVLRPQPPVNRQETDFRNTKPWEPTPRMGSTIPDVCSVWDEGDEIRMLYTNSGMWGGKDHVICLAVSEDGLHWEKPILNLHPWDGTLATNIVIPNASQGSIIKDPNPAALDSERYVYLAWTYYRGYYAYPSPDGVHFTRNETVGFPFDTDGSTSFFWDDQRGIYHAYFRCISPDRKIGRRAGHAKIPQLYEPWPFKPTDRPFIDDLVLGRPALGELPIIDTGGQVYRFKAHKYAWAPDVYVAFPWRYVLDGNIRPGSFLMVSRDGTNWTRYEDSYYFPSGWNLNGREVLEALMEHGMIRRGDELWQFGTVRFTEHGGALYSGVEHEGGTHDRLLRLVQRLDGFVAATPVDLSVGAGTLVTKPFIFSGEHLVLNLDASGGSARVEMQDADGRPILGYGLEDSRPLEEDGTQLKVAWQSRDGLAALAGSPVRLKVELTNAHLFAFQFE
jgi:hypothetical protein